MKEDKSFIELVMVALGGLLLKIKAEVGILLLTFVSFVSPIKGLFFLVGMAVALDTCAGIYVAKKTNKFCSNNLFNVVVKTFFYMGTIFLAFLSDKNVLEKEMFSIPYLIAKVVCCFWVYIEVTSMDEKSQKLGNKPFKIVVGNLIKWVKNVKKDINEIKQ